MPLRLTVFRLTKMQHPNIVKYQGFVKSVETLNIILEYGPPNCAQKGEDTDINADTVRMAHYIRLQRISADSQRT